MFIDEVINKIFGKQNQNQGKFFPVLNERGLAEKPRKFIPLTEREWLLFQRRRGVVGNGRGEM